VPSSVDWPHSSNTEVVSQMQKSILGPATKGEETQAGQAGQVTLYQRKNGAD
jgi:hypothetical protein